MNASIPSPCISVCYLDRNRDHCVGCYRSRAEISEWASADDGRRQQIIEGCKKRRQDVILAARDGSRQLSA